MRAGRTGLDELDEREEHEHGERDGVAPLQVRLKVECHGDVVEVKSMTIF